MVLCVVVCLCVYVVLLFTCAPVRVLPLTRPSSSSQIRLAEISYQNAAWKKIPDRWTPRSMFGIQMNHSRRKTERNSHANKSSPRGFKMSEINIASEKFINAAHLWDLDLLVCPFNVTRQRIHRTREK